MRELQKIGAIPMDLSVLQSLYPHCSNIADKAKRMEDAGLLIRLKRGLYVANIEDGSLSRELVANHLYGPSYVSMSWALRYHGLIPERVYMIQSMTTKHTRQFVNQLGTFSYQNVPDAYFPIGISMRSEGMNHYLIASPEKALCDYVCYNRVPLRFRKDVGVFLEEDLRFDTDMLPDMDLSIIAGCAQTANRTGALQTLLNYLEHERRV